MTRALAQLEKKINWRKTNRYVTAYAWFSVRLKNEEDYEEMKFGNGASFCDRSRGIDRVVSRTRFPGTWNTSTGTDSYLQHRWVK